MTGAALLACVGERWAPRIGDPHPMGWATVAAYALAAGLALAVWRGRRGAGGFWLAVALVMAALAVNKQLDLQSALTAAGRCLAQAQGWYEARRGVQAAFVAGLALAGAVFLALMLRSLRGTGGAHLVAAAGLALTVTFVLTRAVGFHHMDQMLKLRLAGARMNWILELSGIALVTANALALLAKGKGRG